MSLRIEEFKVEHLDLLKPQQAQAAEYKSISDGYRAALEAIGIAVSVFDGDELVAVGGFLQYYPHRAELWSILGESAGKHMTVLTRIARRMLAGCNYDRVESTVLADFAAGHRWLRLLGMEMEHPGIPKFGPNKETMAMYSRIKK